MKHKYKVGDKVTYRDSDGEGHRGVVHQVNTGKYKRYLVMCSNHNTFWYCDETRERNTASTHQDGYYIIGLVDEQTDSEPRLVSEQLLKDLPDQFRDYLDVIRIGAAKHGDNNWLEPNGKKSSHKDMHASMFRHLAHSSAGHRKDDESGLDHLLHLITRAQMMYTRIQRNIKHKED